MIHVKSKQLLASSGVAAQKTRPYTLPPVADGWAGVVEQKSSLFELVTKGQTDRQTDAWTGGQTDMASSRVACPTKD